MVNTVDDLREVVEALHLRGQDVNDDEDFWIDTSPKLNSRADTKETRPRRNGFKGPEIIKRELAEELLSPPTEFNAQWLNRLQQRWDAPVNYADLAELARTHTTTITGFTRHVLERNVTGDN